MSSHPCCSCNGKNAVCKRCSCVRARRPCTTCLPYKDGRCCNTLSTRQVSISNECARTLPSVPLSNDGGLVASANPAAVENSTNLNSLPRHADAINTSCLSSRNAISEEFTIDDPTSKSSWDQFDQLMLRAYGTSPSRSSGFVS